MYKDKEVPCMCCWTPKYSIDGSILLDIVKTLNIFKIYDNDRAMSITHMLLLDAHGSNFDLSFLEYINASAEKWCVCIGVPYGTSLW